MKHDQRRMKLGFSLVASLFSLSVACSNPGKSGGGGETPKTPETTKSSADAKPITPASPQDATGTQIVLSFKGLPSLKNVSGYVVDAIDQHGFKTIDSSGHYAFFSMKPGRYDIILEGQKAGDDTSQSTASTMGIRINGITVKAGENTTIKEPLELLPTFSIKGKVRLLDGVTHGAISIAIPGTKLKAKTESDGSFALPGVPNGSHALVVSNSGFLDASYDSRVWSAQDAPELSAVTLLPVDQTLPTGVHYKGAGIVANEENLVTVFMIRPTGMNQYRLSETADFAGAAWQNYQSSLDIKFPAGGERKVFVQFAKDSVQFSAIFNVDIPMAP